MAGGFLPPVVAELIAKTDGFSAGMAKARVEMEHTSGAGSKAFAGLATAGKAALLGIGAGAVAVGGYSLKMGADFQTALTQLVTGAGEAESNMKLVSDGILAMAAKVGETPKQLAQGLYLIESAGFHGAAGLKVLQVAAEGAKVGAADMATVSDALTSALNAYHLPASSAVSVTNALIATVANGKTHMEDLAHAIGSVLPVAATAGISLEQVGGAIATMTSQGTSADKATVYLRQTIANLENPTAKARQEMQALGLSALDISQNLGKRGLTGTLQLLTEAVTRQMGPAGVVLVEKLQASAKSATGFQAALADLPPTQQTVIAALANMVGGTKSMQAALQLTGGNMATFQGNVTKVGEKLHAGGTAVSGFALVQKDLNFKMESLRATVDALATRLGLWLIPKLEQVAAVTLKVVQWLEKHKAIAMALGITIGTVLVVAITAYIASMVIAAAATIAATWPILVAVAAVVALAAGIVYLWTHWNQIWTWIKDHKAYAAIIAVLLPILPVIFALVGAARYLSEHWSSIWDHISRVVTTAVAAVKAVLNGFAHAPSAFVDWFKHLPGRLLGYLQALPHLLGNIAKLAMQGFGEAAELYFKSILAFFIGIPTLILRAIGSMNRLLWHRGGDVIRGLWEGAKAIFPLVLGWLVALPGRIIAALPGATSWLLQKGYDVMNGLWDGAKQTFANIAAWFRGLPGQIASAIGDAGSILWDIGHKIISGLWDGLKSAWHDVTGWLSGLGGAITSLKGPPAHDAVLLHQNGLLIMQGFRRGLQEGWQATKSDLAAMNAHIGGSVSTPRGAGGASLRAGGSTVNHHYTINISPGLVTDPRGLSSLVVDAIKSHERANGPLPFRVKVA